MKTIQDYIHFDDITPYHGGVTEGPFEVTVLEEGEDFFECLICCIEDTFIQYMYPEQYEAGIEEGYDISIDMVARTFSVSVYVGDEWKDIDGSF